MFDSPFLKRLQPGTLAAVLLALTACDAGTEPSPPPAPVEPAPPQGVFALSRDTAIVAVGGRARLTVSLLQGELPPDFDPRWTSSDTTVASVAKTTLKEGFSAYVQGRRTGTATVSIAAGGSVLTAEVRVLASAVTAIFVRPDTFLVVPGRARQLGAEHILNSGIHREGGPATWTSSNPRVATVDAQGRVTGIAPGRVEITAAHEGVAGTAVVHVDSYPAPLVFTSLSAGQDRVCGATAVGAAYCWGWNGSDLLGTDAPTEQCDRRWNAVYEKRDGGSCATIPRPVAGGVRFAEVSVGGSHTCARSEEGAAYCWGSDEQGQLGRGIGGSGTSSRRPTPVDGGLRFTSIRAGRSHSCGLTQAAEAYCWGFGGSVGTGGVSEGSRPRRVGAELAFRAIDAGFAHSCALTRDGEAYCWGHDLQGELGLGEVTGQCLSVLCTTPHRVRTELRFRDIALGTSVSCALDVGGRAWCWGSGEHGRLGDGAQRSSSVPVAVAGGLVFERLVGGDAGMCGITPGGSLHCWGHNGGHFTDGFGTIAVTRPIAVLPGRAWRDVTLGPWFACGIAVDGIAYCWGGNSVPQLGTGANVDFRPVGPAEVVGQRP